MSIVLSGTQTVAANAKVGTVVGVLSDVALTDPLYTVLFSRSFSVLGDQLVVARSPLPQGLASVIVFGRNLHSFFLFDVGFFNIQIIAPLEIGIDLSKVETTPQLTPSKPGP